MATQAQTGTSAIQGPLWSERANDWATLHEHNMRPVYEAVLDLVHAGPGVSLLEVGCGGGTALRLAADRGADVSALDASHALVEIVQARVPGADVRAGDLQFLPYDGESFDAVVGFNAFQYAADTTAALREAHRVLRPGGLVAIMVWGPQEQCDLAGHLAAVGALVPPPPPGTPGPFALCAPRALHDLVVNAGFEVTIVADASAPFIYASEEIALRALMSGGPCVRAIDAAGEDTVKNTIRDSIADYRTPDDGYRFENVWRFAIGRKARNTDG